MQQVTHMVATKSDDSSTGAPKVNEIAKIKNSRAFNFIVVLRR